MQHKGEAINSTPAQLPTRRGGKHSKASWPALLCTAGTTRAVCDIGAECGVFPWTAEVIAQRMHSGTRIEAMVRYSPSVITT